MKQLIFTLLIALFTISCGTQDEIRSYEATVILDVAGVQVATTINDRFHTDFAESPVTKTVPVKTGDHIGVTVLFPENQEVVPSVLVNNESLDVDHIRFEYKASMEGYISKRYVFIAP